MPIDVRMPDGTLVKNVPDNITQADLMARFDAFKAQPVTSAPTVAPEIQVTPQAPQVGPEGAPIPSVLQTQPQVSEDRPAAGSARKGIVNLQQTVENLKLANLMELQDAYKQQYGQDYENAPPEKVSDLQKLEEDINTSKRVSTSYDLKRQTLSKQYGITPLAQKLDDVQSTPEYQNASGIQKFQAIGETLLKNPGDIPSYIGNIGLESLPNSMAMMASAILARYMTGSPSSTAVAGGATSSFMEFGNQYVNNREQGKSHQDAMTESAVKSGVIGYFDAVSFGSAGKALEAIIKDFKKGAIKATAKEVGKETGKQAGYGAAGEAVGSVITGQEVDPRAVVEEALGEIAGAPMEAVTTYRSTKAAADATPTPPPVSERIEPDVTPIRPRPENIATPAPVESVTAPTKVDTSHDTQAMLDELAGKDIEYIPEEEDKAVEQPKEEPAGVITEEDKEFTPVGGRLINKSDVDKLARESAIALQQNLATQEAESEATLKREIREEKFREPVTQTLSAKLVEEGGIARSQKRDMLGETGKIKGYDHVFRETGGDLLTMVKDGLLDDYLPPDIRSTATPPDGLFDARPGYNYISDLINTNEKVHHYDYEMAKLQHENMVAEKNLAKQQMTPNEAAQAEAAEEQGKIFLSQGEFKGGSTPDVITQSVKSELGKEGSKLLDNEKIVVVKDINDLKEKNYLGDRINQLTDNTRALYDPVTDRSYFIADRMSPTEVRAMAMHEVGTHYGMKKMLGDTAYKTVLNNVKRLSSTDRSVRSSYNETLKSYSNLLETNPESFYEEVLAHLGETAPNHSLWKQLLQKVKTFLIKYGIVKNISAAELQDLVTTSLRRASQEAKSESIKLSERVAQSQIPRNIKGQEVLPQWHGPEESKIDTWLYRLQNKQIDTKRVQELIGDIEEDWNVYEKEQLYHGRTAAGIRNFLLKELLPVIKDIERLKISPEDVRTYLHNRHAEERNNQMNKINPDVYDETTGRTRPNPLKDKGSGISTADARAYLAGLDPARKQVLEQIATKFDQMVKGTQQILINSGAESPETIAKWNSTYEHYVPLFRVEDEMARPSGMGGTGQGFGVRGAFSKRALGSEKDVQDILSNIIAQRERALIRAEKIRVGRALYGLAIQNPNSDFWLAINPDAIRNKKQAIAELRRMGVPDAEQMIDNLMAEPKERYLKKTRAAEEGFEPDEDFDFDSGLPVNESKEVVASKVNVMARYKDFVFPVRINGKDRYIFFNKNDPRALRMVQSLKNLDVENLGYLENIFGIFTRWFKSVNTQYNPVFGLVNFVRDFGGTLLNLTNTEIKGKQAQVIAGAYKAMGGILNVHRAERKGKPPPTGPWAKLYQEARDEGFQTGYRDSLIRNQEEMQIVEHTLSQFKDGNTKKAFYAVLGGLTDYNDMMENAFRLSAYKVARDQGLSKQKAAIIAKNLTVNFDRKGAWTASVNVLYAFFNASVQGTERIYQTLKGPKGKMIIGGGILAGMVQAVMLAAAGYGDDDPPEFVRERNFIIPLVDGTYLTVPYPLGYNILPNSGRIVMDFMIHGGRNPGKHMTSLMSSVMNSFNPLGSSGFAIQTLMPTAIDPIVALAENKDSFGRPIYRPDRATAPTPGYTRSRDTASTLGKGIAEFLNWASGGTKYQKGSISPTGDEVDFLAGQVGGGLYREVTKAGKAVSAAITGEEIPSYQRPVVGRFLGSTGSPAAVSQTFYNNVTRMTDHENEIKGRMKNREDVEGYLNDNPEARLWKRANTIENKINELNKRKRMFIDRGFPKERIQAVDAQKTLLMQRFNDQVSNLTPE